MSERGYAVELRERVVGAVERGMSKDKAAQLFDVGPATVYRWTRIKRERGSLEPLPHGGGQPSALGESGQQVLKELVQEKPDRTIAELTRELATRAKLFVSDSAVFRGLQALGLTLKKKRSRPSRRIAQTSRSATPTT